MLLCAAVRPGLADERLPHGPQTREAFLAAKTLSAAKDGELGDAAVTSDRYDVLRHALDLQVDPATETVTGTVGVVFASEVADLAEVVLDAGADLAIDGVGHVLGPLAFTHAGDSLIVQLPAALAPGEVDSITVSYSADRTNVTVNRGLMFKSHFPLPPIPEEFRVPLVANVSQPAYAQVWWPCKDRPDDKFVFTMNLTVPDTLVGISNGTLVGTADAGPGRRTFSWREDHPIATYLVSVAISDYVLLEEDCLTAGGSDVPLRNWVLPRDVANAAVDFAPLCGMIEFCEGRYGPYPFAGEKYGHAVFIWPGAMEHQTVTSIGTSFVDGSGLNDWLIVHELAHQWFGNSLTPAAWRDIWLNEGFATYAEALWYEHLGGADDYATYMANARHESTWVAEGPVYDPVPVFPGRVIYDKGAWILHMLRDRMGDGPFFDLVAEWSGGPRVQGHVTTEEFIALAGSHAGEDLGDFLWPYLETTVLPAVEMAWRTVDGPNGPGTRLEVDLAQWQSPLFDNVYPLRATTAAGDEDLRLRLATAATRGVFDLAAPATQVALDPDRRLLWRAAGDTAPDAGLVATYPNPSRGNWMVLRYRLENAARPRLRIFDARGGEVFARDLPAAEAGVHEWGWDVTGKRGERLPSGVYWAALVVDGKRSVRKFAVVR